jgi:hypothetical protein
MFTLHLQLGWSNPELLPPRPSRAEATRLLPNLTFDQLQA